RRPASILFHDTYVGRILDRCGPRGRVLLAALEQHLSVAIVTDEEEVAPRTMSTGPFSGDPPQLRDLFLDVAKTSARSSLLVEFPREVSLRKLELFQALPIIQLLQLVWSRAWRDYRTIREPAAPPQHPNQR